VGECTSIFGRIFDVTIEAVSVGNKKPDGDSWDPFGGMPDLMVYFGFLDGETVVTSTIKDSLVAIFWESNSFVWTSGGTFFIALYDDDTNYDDYATSWSWEGDDALVAVARAAGAGTIELTDDSGTVSLTISVEAAF
jgi:hypothetical protein